MTKFKRAIHIASLAGCTLDAARSENRTIAEKEKFDWAMRFALEEWLRSNGQLCFESCLRDAFDHIREGTAENEDPVRLAKENVDETTIPFG